jgi:dihydrofolate reductase
VGAGDVGGQALALGLIDLVAIDIVPVVFGRGKAYFGALADGRLMLEDPDVVIQGDGVLHLRYPVRRERQLRRRPGSNGVEELPRSDRRASSS